MIGYLKGRVVHIESSKIILDVQGLGYEVNFSVHNINLSVNDSIELYVVQKTSDYGASLYGFLTISEKKIFESLDNIKGIGSKAIFSMMTFLSIKSIEDLHNVRLEDLTPLPGIGKTTAQKFLLGLSTKLKKEFSLENDIKQSGLEDSYKDIVDLLVDWGIKKKDVIDFFHTHNIALKQMKSQEIIKFALKELK